MRDRIRAQDIVWMVEVLSRFLFICIVVFYVLVVGFSMFHWMERVEDHVKRLELKAGADTVWEETPTITQREFWRP